MMTCYLPDINKFLKYHTLCKSIISWGFPTKGIELTRFVLFEVLGVHQLWGSLFQTILVGIARKFPKYKWDYGIRNFSVLDKSMRLCVCLNNFFSNKVFPLPWWFFPIRMKTFSQSGKLVLYYEKKGNFLAGAVVVCHS